MYPIGLITPIVLAIKSYIMPNIKRIGEPTANTANLENNFLEIILSKSLYEKEAVFGAAYLFTGKYSIKIEPEEESKIKVTFRPFSSNDNIYFKKIEYEFFNELINQQLRLDLEKRYGKIRELIVEHAFSPLADLRTKVREITHGKCE